MGQKKTPSPFIVACDKFIYLEILKGAPKPRIETGKDRDKKETKVESETLQKVDDATINLISSTITDLADDSGWAFLGEIGSLILKKQPDFDPRNFGFGKLAPLIRSIGKFEIDERESDKKRGKLIYVRLKN